MKKIYSSSLDKVGMCTSIICIAHCISIPLFLLFGMDSLLRLMDQEWLEWVVIGLTLLIGFFSFLGGFLVHKQHFIPVLFVAGFLLIINGESVTHTWVSIGLSVAGALVIVYAHIQNLKWRHFAFAD